MEVEHQRRSGEKRRRVLKKALIVFNNGHCSMGCQITDMSDTGAQLLPTDTLLCPKEFVLKPQIVSPGIVRLDGGGARRSASNSFDEQGAYRA